MIRLAHTTIGRWVISWIITNMSFTIPVHRLRDTKRLMAFHHQQPSYPFHVVIIPKKAIACLEEFDPSDTAFLVDLFTSVQSIVAEHALGENGYRLIVNGGKFQDFPHLHFHLVSEGKEYSSS